MNEFGRFTALYVQTSVFGIPIFFVWAISELSTSITANLILFPVSIAYLAFAFRQTPEWILSIRVRPTPVKAMRQIAAGAGLIMLPVALEPIYRVPDIAFLAFGVSALGLFLVAGFTALFASEDEG